MKPPLQLRGPFTTFPGLSSITTNAGRLSLFVPSPYVTQAPKDGRPPRIEPVFIWHTPLEWFKPFAQHDRITARSSAHSAICGSQSLIHSPDSPCCFHLRFVANNGASYSPMGVITGSKLSGSF